MDFSGDVVFEPFSIGPSSIAGRSLALRILFCKSSYTSLTAIWVLASDYFRFFLRHFFGPLASFLISFLDPRRPSTILASVVAASLLLRRARIVKIKAEASYRRNFWRNMMNSVQTYEEWAHAARMVDKDRSRRRDSDLYDEELVKAKLSELKRRRLQGNVDDIVFCLRADLVRNLGNMCNPELHQGRLQTPQPIQEYINEVRYHLRAVCEENSNDLPLDEKIAFIHETRHAFGRTALLLSGGAGLGAFHIGVVRTLIEHRLFPRVIAGASVGSIICAFAATRTWPELLNFFDDPNPPMHFFESMGSIFESAHLLLTRGAVQDIGHLQRKMRQLIGDMTFQEAYDLSGRVLGIAVSSRRRHDPPRCLNYLTSPHVMIWSAVTASCAFPGLFEAQELMAKDRHGRIVPYHHLAHAEREKVQHAKRQWRDGSLKSDLPMTHLREFFNVNHFIVSQANPHIAPLLRVKEVIRTYGGDFAGKLANLVEMEVKHRCEQALELGFPLGGTAKLFSQAWEGDITIVIPATLAQFAKLIQNPTPTSLRKAVLQGRRCTWAKLSAIQANCGIELILDECVVQLNRQRHTLRNLRTSASAIGCTGVVRRIPSWASQEGSPVSLEDGCTDICMPTGGPWGGSSIKKVRASQNSFDQGDVDNIGSETFNQTWTQAGGPLMGSPSADQLILMLKSQDAVSTHDKTGSKKETMHINHGDDLGDVGKPKLSRTHSLGRNEIGSAKTVAMLTSLKFERSMEEKQGSLRATLTPSKLDRGRSRSWSDILQICSAAKSV